MIQWFIRALIGVALLAAVGTTASDAAAGEDYTVHIEYHGNGTNMNASWSTRAGEDGSAIVCFAEGASGISVCGNEPCVIKSGDWPCWGQERFRDDPDFGAILTINVVPLDGDEIEITGRVHRMVRVDDDLYRTGRDEFSQVETLGEHWTLPLGRDDDGEAYELRVRIEGRTWDTWTFRKQYKFIFRYVMRDLRGDRDDETTLRGQLSVGSDDHETERVDFEAPVEVSGVDSSVLFTQVTLKDCSERSSGIRRSLDVTFAMERQLAMGVLPSSRKGMTQIDGHVMMSSFQKGITLHPGRPLRIAIPQQDVERDYIRTEEYIELEWDEDGGY